MLGQRNNYFTLKHGRKREVVCRSRIYEIGATPVKKIDTIGTAICLTKGNRNERRETVNVEYYERSTECCHFCRSIRSGEQKSPGSDWKEL